MNASSLYADLLNVKTQPYAAALMISKTRCAKAGIQWSFVEDSVAILGLKIEKAGSHGYCVSKK